MHTSKDEATEKLLDEVGLHILLELQENARISFSELGRRVGLTSPAVAERVRRALQFFERECRQEFLRRCLVMIAAIRPEEQREAPDTGRSFDCDDPFEQPFLTDAVLRQLVVNDGVDGDRRLCQPVRERLLSRIEP